MLKLQNNIKALPGTQQLQAIHQAIKQETSITMIFSSLVARRVAGLASRRVAAAARSTTSTKAIAATAAVLPDNNNHHNNNNNNTTRFFSSKDQQQPQAPSSFGHDKMETDKRYQATTDIPESLLQDVDDADNSPFSIRGQFRGTV